MNAIHHDHKNCKFEETYAGCLGRMVNLLESNIGVPANRLLNDKMHGDGSALSSSRSDVSRMNASGDPIEEKVIVPEFKSSFSNKKSNGTPMKMLIDQEMSKEMDSRRDSPNLVAKLMGLDAFPRQEPDSATQRSHSRDHPRSHSDVPVSYWEQQNGFFDYVDPNDHRGVYEIWHHSQKSPHKGRYEETVHDKKMALVRQKFIEVKRLSMDEKLRQSKQFQDALEVLSSNKDLFIECLQEPESIFSGHLHGRQSLPLSREMKRITVLRPSKMANDTFVAVKKDGKQAKKGSFFQLNGLEKIHPGSSPPNLKSRENSPEPTRIVVLKPTPGKPLDFKAVASPPSELTRALNGENFFGDVEDDENQHSREVAKAITQQIREKLGRHRRDETLVSSVLSNGYIGDESSFNRSEIEYADGNFSDSEAMSSVSRHSWDYVNRLGSPYSSSSFTRASYSPESSVGREAKKRLSERWTMMVSSGSCQEHRHVRRSSSTLGEMLALSETKKAASPGEERNCSEEPKDSNFSLVGELREGDVDNSCINLMRSKSVPVSSTEIGTRLNSGISVSDKGITESPKEDIKARSVKSSFRGKVSSLFFSKNKKPVKVNSPASVTKDELCSFSGENHCDVTQSLGDQGSDHAALDLMEPSSNSSSSNLVGIISPKTGFTVEKPIASGNQGENQDQPSPISVLDSSFGEDEPIEKVYPNGVETPLNSVGSNLIDKSPHIGSIVRTLSWDDSCVNITSSRPAEEPLETNEKQEWLIYFKTLVSVAGLQDEVQSTSSLARWHSPESPLDPSLRDKCTDLKDENKLHEAKQRQKRSIQMLVFDSLNSALLDITRHESGLGQVAIRSKNSIPGGALSTVVDEIRAMMNAWFSGCVSDDCGDHNDLVVERVVRKEVVGKEWNGHFRSEMDNLGKGIEVELLEELVQEAVVELTGHV